MTADLAAWRVARNAALRSLDLGYVRSQLPGLANDSDEFVLSILHKCRFDCADLTDDERRESARWLVERRLKDAHGQPIDLAADLPR